MKKIIKTIILTFFLLVFGLNNSTVEATEKSLDNEASLSVENIIESETLSSIDDDYEGNMTEDTDEISIEKKEEIIEPNVELDDVKLDEIEDKLIEPNVELDEINEEEIIKNDNVEDKTETELDTENQPPIADLKTVDPYDQITSGKVVNYYGQVRPNNEGIYTKPKGTENAILYTSYKFNWKDVIIVEEAITNNGVFSKLVTIDTGQEIGWINKKDLYLYDTFTNKSHTEYYAKVLANNSGIFTSPLGTFNPILYTTYKYNDKDVKVIEEGTTSTGTHALLTDFNTGRVLGWINKNELNVYNEVYNTQSVQYYGRIKNINTGIYTQPKGTYNSILYTSYKYNSKSIRILEEAQTTNGIFVKIESIDENRILGWINKNDINVSDDFILSRKSVQKFGVVNSVNSGIYTEPHGTFNSILYTSYKFNNKSVRIVEEADTLNGKYSKLHRIEDNSFIGWIKSNEITGTNFIKNKTTQNFYGKVKSNNAGIYTKPFGDYNSVLYTSYKYNNRDVKIIEEANTLMGAFYKIADNENGAVRGWIRKQDISKYDEIKNVTPVNLFGIVKAKNEGIYTKPKGTQGSILYTTYKMNYKDVKIVEQATANNNVFLKLADIKSNNLIGWIKKSDVSIYDSIQISSKQNYNAKVSSSNQGIYTTPNGTYGTILYTSYLFNNKDVKVVEEAITQSGKFARLARVTDNSIIGWIKKDDLILKKTVFIDVGHGGKDPGAVYYGVNEKAINLKISLKLQDALIKAGYDVIMSRTTDVYIDHTVDRSKLANASAADIFLSVHHNALPQNTNVNGIETYWYKYDPNYPSKINEKSHNNPDRLLKSSVLATEIHRALINETGAYDRGVRRQTFAVLRETAIPAVLLEFGFMSNHNELNKLLNNTYQNKLVKSVVDGVNGYFKLY